MSKESKVQKKALKKVQKEGLKNLKEMGLYKINSEVDKLAKSYTRKGGGLRIRKRKGGQIRQEFKAAKDDDSIMEAAAILFERSSREFGELQKAILDLDTQFQAMTSLRPEIATFMQSEIEAARKKLDSRVAEVASVIGYKQVKRQAKVTKKSGDAAASKELRAQAKVAKLGVKEFKKDEKLLQKQAKSDVKDRGLLIKDKCEKLKSFISEDLGSIYEDLSKKNSEELKKALKLPKQKQQLMFTLVGRDAKKNKDRFSAKAFKGFLDAIQDAQESLREVGLAAVSESEIRSFVDSSKIKKLGFDISQDNVSGLLSGDIFRGGDSIDKSVKIATIIDNVANKYGSDVANDLFDQVKMGSEVMQKYSSQDFTTKYTLISKVIAMREELIDIREQDRALGFQNPDDKYIVGGEKFAISDVITNISELDLKSPAYIQRQYDCLSSAIEQQKQLQPGLIQKSLLETREEIAQLRDIKNKGRSKFKTFSIDCKEGKIWFNKDSTLLVAGDAVTLRFDSQYAQLNDKIDDKDLITKRDQSTSIKMDDMNSIKGGFDAMKLLRFNAAIVEGINNERMKARSSGWGKFKGWLSKAGSKIASIFKISANKPGYQMLTTQNTDLVNESKGKSSPEDSAIATDVDHLDSKSLDSASRSPSPISLDQSLTNRRLQSMPHVKQAVEEGHIPRKRGSFVAQAEAGGHHSHRDSKDDSYVRDMQERKKAAAAADHDHA